MRNVYAIQLSDFYPSATLPQAIGTIWSFACLDSYIAKNYQMQKVFWQNESALEITPQIKNPDVLMCSCYVWNWERTYQVIKWVKTNYPECLIVIGGPEPHYSVEWMQKHTEVDILIPYYGEFVFKNVLIENLTNKNFENLSGIITKNFKTKDYIDYDVSEIPSPYLNGFFDWLLTEQNQNTESVRCVFESNRGCPYSCTFCDIGSIKYQKLKTFDFERVEKELEWMVQNNIKVIDVADANFGILERDEQIVDKLIKLKVSHNWKGRFLPTWSKAKGDRVLKIAKKLIKGKLDSIFGLSLQSLNPETLKNIKRTNAFNLEELSKIVQDMNNEDVHVYTELIFPMPGDTLENFKDGLYKVLDMPNVFNKFQINHLSLYSNAEFADKDYNNKFQIEWAKIKGFTRHYYGNHSSDTIAVANYGLNRNDTFEGIFFSKSLIIPLYFYGIISHTSDVLHKTSGISRSNFFKDIELKLNDTEWFRKFKQESKNHYFDAIIGNKQFGYNFAEDKLQYYPEFAYSHKSFIDNDIYDYLKFWYPDYKNLFLYDENRLWKGYTEEQVIRINDQEWLFADDRQMDKDNYYNEIYIVGRFGDRWKKKIIRKI